MLNNDNKNNKREVHPNSEELGFWKVPLPLLPDNIAVIDRTSLEQL